MRNKILKLLMWKGRLGLTTNDEFDTLVNFIGVSDSFPSLRGGCQILPSLLN